MLYWASIDEKKTVNGFQGSEPPVYHDRGLRVWGDQQVKALAPDIIMIGTYHDNFEQHGHVSRDPLRALLERGWGDYVAIRFDPDHAGFEILVSPSSALPCYVVRSGSRLTIGSDALTVLRASGQPIEVDWESVAFQLCFREARGSRTALCGLTEISAGCVGSILQAEVAITPAWQPARFARQGSGQSIGHNAVLLRRSVQAVISAASGTWRRALIGISGGIDSSIVAVSCLAAGIEFDCFTMYEPDSDGDERLYARVLAAKLGKRLTECAYAIDEVDMDRSSVSSLPRPIGWQFQQSLDARCNVIASDRGADVVLRGTGGDALFYASHTVAPIIDALKHGGPIAGGRTLLDICRLHGCSVWTAARLVLRKLAGPKAKLPRADFSFLHPDRQSLLPTLHPWETGAAGLPSGRYEHIRMIAGMANFVEARLVLATDSSCPLFSQPIIETAVSIPSQHWVHGAINRAVARAAFSDLLPAEILRRRSKGTADAFATRLFESKRDSVREMLMDGLLVENRVLDPGAIHEALSHNHGSNPQNIQRLLALADAEAWVRHWTSLAGLPAVPL